MRKILKLAGRFLLVLVVVLAALGLWKREEIARLMAVNSLFSEEKIVHNFSHMGDLFYSLPMSKGDGPASPLPIGAPMALPGGYASWVQERALTAIVVLKGGAIRHEAYYQGTGPEDLRISWSMAKSFLSVLLGILMEEGAIASLSDPVIKYAPALAGSAYAKASIEDVLQMESGVKFNEDYLDFWSDINKMGRVLALGRSMDGFAAGLQETTRNPGEAWHYVSIDTHVIGMVIRGATGRSIPDLLQEKVLAPLGLEADPYYLSDGHRTAFVLGGLNLRTRDYARFGQMVAQDGAWQGKRIVSAEWLTASTTPSAKTEPGAEQYGLQWWMPKDGRPGEVYAIGVYGQYIYIDRAGGVVIAVNAADRKFKEAGVNDAMIAMFRQIAEAAQ